MSSEQLGSGVNILKGDLAASFDILSGSAASYQDLGIARRFGGSAAAYSLRDIGAMNGPVVNVRREPYDKDGVGGASNPNDETDFSASQVASGALEDWVNGKLENTLPADVATASAAYSLRKVKASYTDDAVRIRRSSDGVEVDVAFDSDDKVSSSSPITDGGTELTPDPDADLGSTSATTLGSFLSETAPNFSGNALNFDGSSTYVNISQITLSGDFTFSFDAFVDFNNGGGGRVAGRTTAAGWVANIADSTSLSFRANGSGGKAITFDSAISSGEHSFVLTRSSNTVSLSIDGVTQANTRTEENNFTINFIGRQASNYFKGSLRNINFGSASYNGYGNTDADWEDQTGSNDGTITGTADTFIGDAAFVHTWYDQTDNNDAIEETAVNQPKIAENGSVFNHINFDGNTFLNIGANLMDATDGTTSMVMSNIDRDVQTFYLSSRDGNDGFNFFNDTGAGEKGKFKYAFVGSGASLTSNAFVSDNSDDKFLVTFTKDSNDREFFGNGAVLADDGASNTYASAGGTNTSIGKQGNSPTASTLKLMRVYEIVSYDTDETDNRFKIESNINNYYNLYNDANELAGDFTDTGATRNVVINGKNGFTGQSEDGDFGFFGVQLKQKVLDNDLIHISFNCNKGSSSPTVSLRKTGIDGVVASDSPSANGLVSVVNGFNSVSFTSNDSDAEFISFADESEALFSVTDFKVSRISRNGFVETWYDQSGNGNDATQGTAEKQPKIVENGSLVLNANGFPSIKFESANSTELDIGNLMSNLNSVSAYAVTQKDDTDSNVAAGLNQGASGDSSRFFLPFYTSSTAPKFGYDNSAAKISFGTVSTRTCNMYSVFSGDTNIEAFLNGSSVGTATLVDRSVTSSTSKLGQIGNTFRFDGVMSEIYLTTNKLQDDASDINRDVTNYYNL